AHGLDRAVRPQATHALIGMGPLPPLPPRVEHRQAKMGAAALTGRDTADHARAIGDRLLGMKGAIPAGEALADHLRILVDEDAHLFVLTACTIFCAASSRSSAEVTSRLDVAMMSLPRSTLVPSSRTTSGTRKPTSLTAAT